MEAENGIEMEGYRSEDPPEIENMAVKHVDPVDPVVPAEDLARPENEAPGGERALSLDQSTPVGSRRDERIPTSRVQQISSMCPPESEDSQ